MNQKLVNQYNMIIFNQNIKTNAKLCYMDTNNFIIHIKTEDFYKDIADYIRKDTIHQIMNRINEM